MAPLAESGLTILKNGQAGYAIRNKDRALALRS
jgi:biotin operon repressor